MRVRAKVTYRNDHMVEARARLGFTQKTLGRAVGIGQTTISEIERFDYSALTKSKVMDICENIAAMLDLSLENVAPKELVGRKLSLDRVSIAEIEVSRLAAAKESQQRFICAGADEVFEKKATQKEMQDDLKKALSELSVRNRDMFCMRYGILDYSVEYTFEEIGWIHKITRERVRQIVLKVERFLQHPKHNLEKFFAE